MSRAHRIFQATISAVSSDVIAATLSDGTSVYIPVVDEGLQDRVILPGETHWVVKFEDESGPIASLASPDVVHSFLEAIVPEVRRGEIRIVDVARAPGHRSKIAVALTESAASGIDPVGVCVGYHANRVKALGELLSGERVDIVAWQPDPLEYARAALMPGRVDEVRMSASEENVIEAVVPRHLMATTVGGNGLNARLASQLVGTKITVVEKTAA